MVIEDKARIAEEVVTQILSKKADLQKKIHEMVGSRVFVEYDLRTERCRLLEMIISAHDGAEDHRGLVERVEDTVKSKEKKLDLVDGKLYALKHEEARLAQELKCAQDSHFGIVQVLEELQSEQDVLHYC